MFWQVLIGNVTAVALLISVWMHLHYKFYRLSAAQSNMAFGLMMGLAALVSMLLSVRIDAGYYLDLRSTLLTISAIYGGPLAIAVTGPMTLAGRAYMGGVGMVPGLISITILSLVSLAVHFLLGRSAARPKGIWIAALTVTAVSLTMSVVFDARGTGFGTISLLMTGLKFIATLLAASVITYFRGFTVERDMLRAALTQAPDFHYVKNLGSAFVVANLNVARQHGRMRSSDMVGLTDFELYPRDIAQKYFDREQAIMNTGEPMVDFEDYLPEENGPGRWSLISKVPLRNRYGDLIGLAGVTRDITERKRLEQELLDSRNLLSQAMAEMSDGLAMFNPEGRLLFCNEQYRAAFPRSAYARQPGAHIADIVRAVIRNAERTDVNTDVDEEWIQASAQQLFLERDTEIPMFDGRWLSLRTRLAADGSALVVVSDITAMKQSEEHLKKLAEDMRGLAETDALTGIANRRAFDNAVAREFSSVARNGSPLSLLLIDIDHFKAFNDTYGHIEGDRCLRQISACLTAVCKRPSDLAARYGGEEFAILLPGMDVDGAMHVGESLRLQLHLSAIPHRASAKSVVTTSIGVASIGPTSFLSTPSELVQAADLALYEAKTGGRDRIAVCPVPTRAA
ncbi:diguanylate cyclase [Rhizobium sp. ICMP 5592]|uniref:diguanylate cyclase n=1 Tax=Rhizobium sp. ICMP 5592 TaxID=2292445 RepID=UPI001294BD13|nr:diguanylate cyclase [Rhizobium sp. ICMP 5592]MQB44985.1 diguanylate cyclase [Rhizobium sp. ICMP 5592]